MKVFEIKNPTTGYKGPGKVNGVCMAMSCDWAATSLKHDGVRYPEMLNQAKWNILQAAYHFGIGKNDWKSIIEAAGLVYLKETTCEATGDIDAFAEAIPTWLLDIVRGLNGKTGTWLVVMSGNNGGHATGFRRREDVLFEFFDPNFGLWRFTNEDLFLGTVNEKMKNYAGLMHEGVAAIEVAR